MSLDRELVALAEQVVAANRAAGRRISTAESCTGGLVGAAITEIAGASDVYGAGFITYANNAKMRMLGVAASTLQQHGAVSEPTAREMAEGALRESRAGVAVAISGVAGPGGGTAEKPVGTVAFARATADGATVTETRQFGDLGRAEIRRQAALLALRLLLP